MKNTITKLQFPVKKLIGTVIIIIIFIVIGIIISIPVRSNLDHNRFTVLDTKSQNIYQTLVKTSRGAEQWHYNASCSPVMSGDWETGDYTCSTVASTDKTISSVVELNALQAKYYTVVNGSSDLTSTKPLDLQPVGSFGKQFVVSSVERGYTMSSTNIPCTYLIKLAQSDGELSHSQYGTLVEKNSGVARISFECGDRSLGVWYSLK